MPAIDLHQLATDGELDTLVTVALQEAGVTLDDLHRQAREGRFRSEQARRAWFVVRGLGRG